VALQDRPGYTWKHTGVETSNEIVQGWFNGRQNLPPPVACCREIIVGLTIDKRREMVGLLRGDGPVVGQRIAKTVYVRPTDDALSFRRWQPGQQRQTRQKWRSFGKLETDTSHLVTPLEETATGLVENRRMTMRQLGQDYHNSTGGDRSVCLKMSVGWPIHFVQRSPKKEIRAGSARLDMARWDWTPDSCDLGRCLSWAWHAGYVG
jgi:hypothetical protein